MIARCEKRCWALRRGRRQISKCSGTLRESWGSISAPYLLIFVAKYLLIFVAQCLLIFVAQYLLYISVLLLCEVPYLHICFFLHPKNAASSSQAFIHHRYMQEVQEARAINNLLNLIRKLCRYSPLFYGFYANQPQSRSGYQVQFCHKCWNAFYSDKQILLW